MYQKKKKKKEEDGFNLNNQVLPKLWPIKWGKKVFNQPPIVQVLPLEKSPVIFFIDIAQLWDNMRKKSR